MEPHFFPRIPLWRTQQQGASSVETSNTISYKHIIQTYHSNISQQLDQKQIKTKSSQFFALQNIFLTPVVKEEWKVIIGSWRYCDQWRSLMPRPSLWGPEENQNGPRRGVWYYCYCSEVCEDMVLKFSAVHGSEQILFKLKSVAVHGSEQIILCSNKTTDCLTVIGT